MAKKTRKAKAPPTPAPVRDVFDGTKLFEVTDLDRAFPTELSWFTPYEQIPVELRQANLWRDLWAACWFGHEPWSKLRLLPKKPINEGNKLSNGAIRMLEVVSGCFGIQHEHKEALASFILASFFDLGWFEGKEPPEIREMLADATSNL